MKVNTAQLLYICVCVWNYIYPQANNLCESLWIDDNFKNNFQQDNKWITFLDFDA